MLERGLRYACLLLTHPSTLHPVTRNLGCANTQCNLCKLSQRRRCPTNFAGKYLAPCDVVEAKCGAQIYVVVVEEATGQLVQQGLEDLAILVRTGWAKLGEGRGHGQ